MTAPPVYAECHWFSVTSVVLHPLFLPSCSNPVYLSCGSPLFLLSCSSPLFLSCNSSLFLLSCSSLLFLLSCSSPLFLSCSGHQVLCCSSPAYVAGHQNNPTYVTGLQSGSTYVTGLLVILQSGSTHLIFLLPVFQSGSTGLVIFLPPGCPPKQHYLSFVPPGLPMPLLLPGSCLLAPSTRSAWFTHFFSSSTYKYSALPFPLCQMIASAPFYLLCLQPLISSYQPCFPALDPHFQPKPHQHQVPSFQPNPQLLVLSFQPKPQPQLHAQAFPGLHSLSPAFKINTLFPYLLAIQCLHLGSPALSLVTPTQFETAGHTVTRGTSCKGKLQPLCCTSGPGPERKDAYPLPRIEESLDALTGAKWFTTLDLASGHYQVPVAETDEYKTDFYTPFGLFELN
ncbi:uncharacterized protein LOC122974482 [Thunnus albacares]|uniref:uncharacterized protein LOC122974482 n=1 Tax=Thunnus albacares TaxID=8236 RepID=UPI001CF67943|nr:uncharacterized protein LOC122974482 [Thunnus albacares]